MRLKYAFFFFVLLLFLSGVSYAETIDNSNSRTDYARSVSLLNQQQKNTKSPRSAEKSEQPVYTLVLFRTKKGIPDFDIYEPDILIMGPHGCFTAAYLDQEKAVLAIEHLHTIPEVIYAELDGEVFSCDETENNTESTEEAEEENPEYSFHSYGAYEMGFQDAVSWSKKAGEGSVLVAVIDSGVYPHSFVSSRLSQSGFDYVDSDEDSTNDLYGHGTHVAGIIVDCTPDLPVYLRPIRVLNASGKGSTANTTSAIFEAAEAGCDVINMSLVSSTHSEALEDAILYALGCGTTVVISAGNSGDSTVRYCPVHLEEPGFIVVGACAGSMEEPVAAAYSNYGSSVDVFAFGNAIQSCSLSGGYTSQTGTSQAAPHVSALCAIMKMLFPAIGCEQIESRIKVLSGDGEVNVPNAALLVPLTMGIKASEIYLPIGTQINLLQNAIPRTSFISINWSCEDETIASVDDTGILSCISAGTTVLSGNGPAKADIRVILHVIAETSAFKFPSVIKRLEKDAFFGTGAEIIYLPDEIEIIEERVFDQTELKTVFYYGHNNIFDNLQEGGNTICIVIQDDRELIKELNMIGMKYIINISD